jgi:pimeloyl-ACP methyl ester carboxylesterase
MPTITRGGCSISYETAGQGTPVVMVYGIGGDSLQWWEEFPRLLAGRHRVVMLDNRGTGRSDRPREPWTMADMIGDVEAVIADARTGSFHLLGCSLGSMIARHFVRQRGGGRIRSLSLLCPPNGIRATEEDMRTALFWDPNKPLIESAEASWPIVHPEPWIAANRELLVAKFEESMQKPTPSRTFQFQLQAVEAEGGEDVMNSALNTHPWPVLILHGTADRLVPFENALALARAVPRARLEPLDGLSHNFWQHEPARSAEIVLDFLAKADSGASE